MLFAFYTLILSQMYYGVFKEVTWRDIFAFLDNRKYIFVYSYILLSFCFNFL